MRVSGKTDDRGGCHEEERNGKREQVRGFRERERERERGFREDEEARIWLGGTPQLERLNRP